MATYTPGTIGGTAGSAGTWINRVWTPEFDVQAQEEAKVYTRVARLMKPHGQINIPFIGVPTTNALSDTSATNATSLTSSSQTEGSATATPASAYCYIEVGMNVLVRVVTDPMQSLRRAIVKSLTAKIDSDVASLAAALTTNIAGDSTQNLDKGMILDAGQKLAAGGKEFYSPERDQGIFIVYVNQTDDLMNITDLTSAQIRGDNENPIPGGWVKHGLGFTYSETGNISTASGVASNLAFIPPALGAQFAGIAFNQDPTVVAQEYQLAQRIIAWADYAYLTVRDAYGVCVRTTTA